VVAGRAGWLGVALVAGCSGAPRAEDAAHGLAARDDAGPATGRDAAAADPAVEPGRGGTGDLQVRVEWPDTPVAARRSPGRTRCNTPRLAAVTPTTTWGIPDVLVVIEGAAPPRAAAHVTLADCALTPRIAVGDSLAITSAVDRPAKLLLRKGGALDQLAGPAAASPAIPVLLPIAGHTVTAALEPSVAYSLETDAAIPEVAVVAAVAGGYITEANGQVIARDLALGPHAVTVWLPARAGQPGRTGQGTATITAGDLATLTISLAP